MRNSNPGFILCANIYPKGSNIEGSQNYQKKGRNKANYYLCKELYKLLSVGFEVGRTPRHNILYSNSCNIIHRKSNISSANPDTST